MKDMKDKERAKSEWWNMIQKSWTWNRLTQEEQDKFCRKFVFVNPKGTYRQRLEVLEIFYEGFLTALDYKPIGWRETDRNTPNF